MSEYQEFTGKTVEEALRNATETFGVAGLQDLDFEILTQGSRGVLGMGAEPARIIAAPRSALGGAAPRREAAEASAPPPAAGREGAGRRDDERRDRGERRGGPDRSERRDRDERADRDERRERPPRRDRDERPERPSREVAEPMQAEAAGREDDEARPAPRRERPADDDRGERRSRGGRAGRGRGTGEGRGTGTSRVPSDVVVEASAPREETEEQEITPETLEAGRQLLEQLVELMGYRATVEATAGPTAKITVFGADDEEKEALGALIGRKGERLSALQHLVNLMLSRNVGTWTRVLVDVEDYRGRRERQLAEVALRAAERVQETGQMLQLEPMSALERRWVHLSLRDVEGVTTQSIGEEPTRRVVVLKA